MIQKSSANSIQQTLERNCSGQGEEGKEQATGPIIVAGGIIDDVKAAVPVDEQKLISLEARMCGNKYESCKN